MGAPASDADRLSASTTLGAVSLTAADLGRARAFYSEALGLLPRVMENGEVALTADAEGAPLVRLRGDPAAPARDPRAPGLFHLAILYPDRAALATALLRLARAGSRLTGASDHLVSEALYLHAPEGNGVELYHDRPAAQWPRDAAGEGAAGLHHFEIVVDGPAELMQVTQRLHAAGADAGGDPTGAANLRVRDPFGSMVELRCACRALVLPFASSRRRGGVATQRPAKPSTPVRFRSSP